MQGRFVQKLTHTHIVMSNRLKTCFIFVNLMANSCVLIVEKYAEQVGKDWIGYYP